MKQFIGYSRTIFLLLLLVKVVSCKEDDKSEPANDYLSQMATIEAEITSILITNCTNAGQCQSAAIGVKPCGGPTHFVIYSGVTTSEEQLLNLINQYNQINQAYNEALNLGSDCAVETPPNLGCVDGNCAAI